MTRSLRITVAQPACVPGDLEANAVAHAAVVRSSGARVVVFPELSLTGYEMTARSVTPGDPRLKPIVESCQRAGAIALAGAPVVGDRGEEYMAMLAVDDAGVLVAYRKMWLSPPEDERFVAGPGPAVLTVDGWRLGLAVCRDVTVPEHARATAEEGIDAYLVGSLTRPGRSRDRRMRSIAAEHDVWVAVASFAGPSGDYPVTSGGSGVWAPGGELVSQADAIAGSAATVELHR